MVGRPKGKAFNELGFYLGKNNGKHVATCTVCNKQLQNTASNRLKGHRNICKIPTDTDNSKNDTNIVILDSSDTNRSDAALEISSQQNISETYVVQSSSSSSNPTVCSQLSNISNHLSSSYIIESSSSSIDQPIIGSVISLDQISSKQNIQRSFGSPKQNKRVSKTMKNTSTVANYIDRLNEKEEKELNEELAKLIFGCNLPLRLVESKHFKSFIRKLRPAYALKLPGRKALSTTLLDDAYSNCISNAKARISEESVLLIDGWKNSASNSKLVVTMLHDASNEQAFLQAWDLTGESETGEKLAEILMESVDIAKELYNAKVYAVVSDNASCMLKMGRLTSHILWHSTCNSHTANLLAKDVLDTALTDRLLIVLKEFKHSDFEKQIVMYGGSKVSLPCETRWCSYRDAYQSLINNLQYMKKVTVESKCKKVKPAVVALIFEDEFIEKIKDNIKIFDPICHIINMCQSTSFSIADSANLWLDLQLPIKFKSKLNSRKEMALNEYALTAFYLHPLMDSGKLKSEHTNKINNFILRKFNGAGIEEFDDFRSQNPFFKMLFEKCIKRPLVFWNMAQTKYPILSQFAKQLLKVPASSAQIERVFSSWAHVHSPIRNRLSFERSKKLLHVYYSLRINDELDYTELEEELDELIQS